MAIGDDALAAGIQLTPGTLPANQLDTELNAVKDEIARRTSAVLPVAKGGTGSTTAEAARTALGIPVFSAPDQARPNQLARYNAAGQLTSYGPSALGHVATKEYVDDIAATKLTRTGGQYNDDFTARDNAISSKRNYDDGYFPGDLNTNNIYLRQSFAASSGWTNAYIDGSGRLAKGTSSLRYKDLLDDPDVSTLGNIFPTLRQYAMKGGDGKPTLGYIAEEVAADPDTERFAVYRFEQDDSGNWGPTDVVDSIDFIQLLTAQVAVLNARVAALEDAVAA